ncbi:LysR family transcriptional regulator [Pseudomonas aeruginosa]
MALERLGKTPSAPDQAVAHLEAELGARLFERTTRSLALTEAGQIYLEAARQSWKRCARRGRRSNCWSRSCAANCASPRRRRSPRRSSSRACASFLEAHPRISLRVDLDETFLDLSEGGYDLGLRDGPIDLPGLVRCRWRRTRSCFAPAPPTWRGSPRRKARRTSSGTPGWSSSTLR